MFLEFETHWTGLMDFDMGFVCLWESISLICLKVSFGNMDDGVISIQGSRYDGPKSYLPYQESGVDPCWPMLNMTISCSFFAVFWMLELSWIIIKGVQLELGEGVLTWTGLVVTQWRPHTHSGTPCQGPHGFGHAWLRIDEVGTVSLKKLTCLLNYPCNPEPHKSISMTIKNIACHESTCFSS